MPRKTNKQKREEIQAMEDRFKDENESKDIKAIEKVNSMFDELGSLPVGSEERIIKLVKIVDGYSRGRLIRSENVKSQYRLRCKEFKEELIYIKKNSDKYLSF